MQSTDLSQNCLFDPFLHTECCLTFLCCCQPQQQNPQIHPACLQKFKRLQYKVHNTSDKWLKLTFLSGVQLRPKPQLCRKVLFTTESQPVRIMWFSMNYLSILYLHSWEHHEALDVDICDLVLRILPYSCNMDKLYYYFPVVWSQITNVLKTLG